MFIVVQFFIFYITDLEIPIIIEEITLSLNKYASELLTWTRRDLCEMLKAILNEILPFLNLLFNDLLNSGTRLKIYK